MFEINVSSDPKAYSISNATRTLLMVNDSYANMLGYEACELVGTSWNRLLPPEEITRATTRLECLLAHGGSRQSYIQMRRSDSRLIRVCTVSSVIRCPSTEPMIHSSLVPVPDEYTQHFNDETFRGAVELIEEMTSELAILAFRHRLLRLETVLRNTNIVALEELERLNDYRSRSR
ncbi:PAS domain-containing protein [Lichenihabitans sp. PAMC28606]|uniref:PAS domain-containing protein n=1 Tax=Lichenihabitans sp. PAMC28606 TaxID=2880932 RepID=UPI001D0A3C4D|nr:PAS domain-containing protein [Lichenihabitans sp. PAMC28606]